MVADGFQNLSLADVRFAELMRSGFHEFSKGRQLLIPDLQAHYFPFISAIWRRVAQQSIMSWYLGVCDSISSMNSL